MIRTLIFDLGKTLVPFDFDRGFRTIAQDCPYPPEEIRQRLLGTNLASRFESGQMTPEDFVREVEQVLSLREGHRFTSAWNEIFLPEPLVPEEALDYLHARYRLLLLSNTNALHFEWLVAQYPLLRHFDHYVLSFRVGAMKPSPAIFEEALRHAQCAAEECFFTDDIEAYVQAARDLGMHGTAFQGWPQLRQQLIELGVDCP